MTLPLLSILVFLPLLGALLLWLLPLPLAIPTYIAAYVYVDLFEPLGLYGRWLKIKLFFQLFPLYKRATFKRQKIYVKSERNR